MSGNLEQMIVLYLIAHLPFYHKKAINAPCELTAKLPTIYLPHQDEESR